MGQLEKQCYDVYMCGDTCWQLYHNFALDSAITFNWHWKFEYNIDPQLSEIIGLVGWMVVCLAWSGWFDWLWVVW